MADEIIEELWRVKEEMAREHGYDIEAFGAYLQRKDREAGFRKVDPQKQKEMTEAGEVRQKRKNEFTAIMERDGGCCRKGRRFRKIFWSRRRWRSWPRRRG